MVHAGTFFGDMLPSFSRSCRATVYAFEPVLENYVLAKLCLQENGLKNVVLMNAALGESLGVAYMDTGQDGGWHHGGGSRVANSGQVTAVLPIDALKISDLAVLQLDVEGFELPALKGSVETIRSCRPIILIEDNSRNCAPFLSGIGYAKVGAIPGLDVWCDETTAVSVGKAIAAL